MREGGVKKSEKKLETSFMDGPEESASLSKNYSYYLLLK